MVVSLGGTQWASVPSATWPRPLSLLGWHPGLLRHQADFRSDRGQSKLQSASGQTLGCTLLEA